MLHSFHRIDYKMPGKKDICKDAVIIVKGAILAGYWLCTNVMDMGCLFCGEMIEDDIKTYFVHLFNAQKAITLYNGNNLNHAANYFIYEIGPKDAIKSVSECVRDTDDSLTASENEDYSALQRTW